MSMSKEKYIHVAFFFGGGGGGEGGGGDFAPHPKIPWGA